MPSSGRLLLVLPLFQRAGTTPMASARGALASWRHSKRPHQGKIYSCGVVLLLSRTLCPRKVMGLIPIRSTKSKNPNPFPIGEGFGFLLSGAAFCVPVQFIPSTRNRHSRLRRHFDRPGFLVWSGRTRNWPSPRTNPSTGTAIGRWSFCYTRWRFRKSKITWMVAEQ